MADALDMATMDGNTGQLDLLADCDPIDPPDTIMALLRIHDLHTLPVDQTGGTARYQHHPAVATLKWRLEETFVAELVQADDQRGWNLPDDSVEAIRTISAAERVPPLYGWLAETATEADLLEFLALEGGPDGGFDDLVATCQIGLTGEPKLELARNYWDEMGRGLAAGVHTTLHQQLTDALDLPVIPRPKQPLEALHRSALNSLLATNRWLQPEMLGALGLIELQAGPRCRKVILALQRLDLPEAALPFYREHAQTDPLHGRDWTDHVIAPLADADPELGHRMVQGARWRSTANASFLSAVALRLGI